MNFSFIRNFDKLFYTCFSLTWETCSLADKPSIPLGPLKVEEVRADHVKVKWDKPEDNGGTEITGYVLEKMDLDTGRWIPAGEVGPNEKTFTFSGLTPKKKYKFRVKAVNKEGESEPLEVEEAILAKNPYGKGTSKYFTIIFKNN